MEDDFEILKVEYLSNNWLDLFQILNVSLENQTKSKNLLKWRRPRMEEDLHILQVEYLSNYLFDHFQI